MESNLPPCGSDEDDPSLELTRRAFLGGIAVGTAVVAFGPIPIAHAAVPLPRGVDPDLGEVPVARAVAAFAGGTILNTKTARSQLLGGIVFGIGMALTEKTELNPRTGRFITQDLADYHLPVNRDVPSVEVILVEEVDPYVNEAGAKGLGEIGITGMPAAIANAVYHATGVRVRELPITPDKLLRRS